MALTSSDWRRYLYPDPTGQMPAAGLLVTYLHQTDPLGASDLGLEWSPEPVFHPCSSGAFISRAV